MASTDISFSGNLIADEGAGSLANAIKEDSMPLLKELYLGRNEIRDAGVQALLPALAKLPLTILNLSYNLITDVGGAAIGNAVIDRDVEHAHFDYSFIRKEFVESTPYPRLKELWLQGNRIGNLGTNAIAMALEGGALPAIEEITLQSNPCSAATLVKFTRALNVRKTNKVNKVDMKELAKNFHYLE